MTIEKQVVVDKFEVLEMGQIQVRTATKIVEDGEALSVSYQRHVIAPGDDISLEDSRVQAVANTLWDSTVISNYLASI